MEEIVDGLKLIIEDLHNDLREAEQEITWVIEDQEKFINYLREKEKADSKHKKIYSEIIKEYEKIMI